MSMAKAQEVVDTHTRMRDAYASPRPQLLRGLNGFMENTARVAYDEGGEKEVIEAMSAMFYPARSAEELARLISRELFMARTFQVTDEMCEAVTGTFKNSAKTIGRFQQEELPAEAGFVWLDTPFMTSDKNGKEIATRAISWSPQALRYPENGKDHDHDVVSGVRVTCWHHPDDHDDWWEPDDVRAAQVSGAPLALSHSLVMPFGQRFGGHDGSTQEMYADDFLHWLHTLWVFLDSEITVTRQGELTRPFRKRASRSLKYPGLNIVMLRRIRPAGDPDREPARRLIDWAVQWVVQGHHRHLDKYTGTRHHAVPLPYDRGRCATCEGRITWVHAYIKGPEGAPLRSADQLYRLAR